MKRIFKFLVAGFLMFAVAYVLASYFVQSAQGNEGEYRYEGDITGLSYQKNEIEEYVLVEIDNPAVFCDEAKKCDDNVRTGFAVENVTQDELRLGQHISIKCFVAPFSWISSLNVDRVTCGVLK